MIKNLNHLNTIAKGRGQSLAQMALAWVLRKESMTSALIGVSSPEQILDCVGSLKNLIFTDNELLEIDKYAIDENINLWAESSEL